MAHETLIDIDNFTAAVSARDEFWEDMAYREALYRAHPPLIISLPKKSLWQRICDFFAGGT